MLDQHLHGLYVIGIRTPHLVFKLVYGLYASLTKHKKVGGKPSSSLTNYPCEYVYACPLKIQSLKNKIMIVTPNQNHTKLKSRHLIRSSFGTLD